MPVLGNTRISVNSPGNYGGHHAVRGAAVLVDGTAAVPCPFDRVDSYAITPATGTATPDGTVQYSAGHTYSTASGFITLTNKWFVIRCTDEASTNQVAFYITGF